MNKSGPVSCGLISNYILRLYTYVWVEPINISTLVVLWTSPYLLPKPVQIPNFVCSGTMVIELHEFNDKKKTEKKKNMDKMQKLKFVIIWPKSKHLMKYLVYTHLCCKIIKSLIDLKLKARSEFPLCMGRIQKL